MPCVAFASKNLIKQGKYIKIQVYYECRRHDTFSKPRACALGYEECRPCRAHLHYLPYINYFVFGEGDPVRFGREE